VLAIANAYVLRCQACLHNDNIGAIAERKLEAHTSDSIYENVIWRQCETDDASKISSPCSSGKGGEVFVSVPH